MGREQVVLAHHPEHVRLLGNLSGSPRQTPEADAQTLRCPSAAPRGIALQSRPFKWPPAEPPSRDRGLRSNQGSFAGGQLSGGHAAVDFETWRRTRNGQNPRPHRPVVFTTRFPSPVPSRCVIESRAPSSTTGKTDAMPDAFGSPSCSTVAPSRSVGSSRAPSRRDR